MCVITFATCVYVITATEHRVLMASCEPAQLVFLLVQDEACPLPIRQALTCRIGSCTVWARARANFTTSS
jgi:hypothetical protein